MGSKARKVGIGAAALIAVLGALMVIGLVMPPPTEDSVTPTSVNMEVCDALEDVVISGMETLTAYTNLWTAKADEGSDVVELPDGFYLHVPESEVDGYIDSYHTTEDALNDFKEMQCPGWQEMPDMPYDIDEPLQYLVYG